MWLLLLLVTFFSARILYPVRCTCQGEKLRVPKTLRRGDDALTLLVPCLRREECMHASAQARRLVHRASEPLVRHG
jgi:hypothetical protein